MKVVSLICLLVLVGQAQSRGPASSRELVGLKGLGATAADPLRSFDMTLTEGRIVAVCTVPNGWKITAENLGEAGSYKNGGGSIKGEAGFAHDALSDQDLKNQGPFLLLDVSTVHRKPATLSGSATVVGLRGNRTVQLEPGNFQRESGSRCR